MFRAASSVHYTTSCKHKSSAPEDGRNYRPKHVELIEIINKPLLLHLVGCLFHCRSSNKWGHGTVQVSASEYRVSGMQFVLVGNE